MTVSLYLITERGISYVLTFSFLSPTNEHVSTRRFHSSSGKIARRLLSRARDISIHFYIRSLRQRYYDERGNSSFRHSSQENGLSVLNEIRVGINNKRNIFTWQLFDEEKKLTETKMN